MIKNTVIAILLAACAGSAFAYVDPNGDDQIPFIAKRIPKNIKTIVIDPGHGGKDFGAIGKGGIREKDVNLLLAKRLKSYLMNDGFEVLLTRDADVFVSLQERADFVNKIEADLFVSIHCNAARNRTAHGFETFYLSHPMNDYADASVTGGDGYVKYDNFSDENSEIGKLYIKLLDSASSADRAFSIRLADLINQGLKGFIGGRNRGVKRARFFVLRNTAMPAVLVEVGFISNPKEETMLAKRFHRDNIAKAIAQGIVNFRNDLGGFAQRLGMRDSEDAVPIHD
jgi:N-acetylmuramoyl-L-alanine amidase